MDQGNLKKIALSVIILWAVISFFGELSDMIKNTIDLFKLKAAIIFCGVSLILYLITIFYLKYKGVNWKIRDGSKVKITKLGKEINLYIYITWGVVLIAGILNNYMSKEAVPVNNNNASVPYFEVADKKFKILILPFKKECEYNGALLDIGNVLNRRFEALGIYDSLNLYSKYVENIPMTSDGSKKYYDSVLFANNADMIIYGFYSVKDCESDGLTKICFNYQTIVAGWSGIENAENTEYKMFPIKGMDLLREGSGQESIDYIIYFMSAFSMLKEKKPLSAIERFKKIKNYKSYFQTLSYIGDTYCRIKKFNLALEYYHIANEIRDKNPRIYNNIATCYMELGLYDSVEKYIKEAVRLAPEYYTYTHNYIGFYFKTKQFGKATELTNSYLFRYPNEGLAIHDLGSIYMETKNYALANSYFFKEISISGRSENNLFWLAESYNKMLNYKDAISAYMELLSINPKNQFALTNLGGIYQDMGNYILSIEYYNRSLSIKPNNLEATASLGYTYLLANDYDNAKKYLVSALSQSPDKSQEELIKINLGRLAIEMQEVVIANNYLNDLLKNFNGSANIYLFAARYYCIKGDKDNANIYLLKSIKLDPKLRKDAVNDNCLKNYSYRFLKPIKSRIV